MVSAEPTATVDDKSAKIIRATLLTVILDLERLEEAAEDELSGPVRAKVYRAANDLLGTLIPAHERFRAQIDRKSLHKTFAEFDSKTHELIQMVKATKNRALHRIAQRLYYDDLELHFQIYRDDSTKKQISELIHRQIHAFALTAEKLNKTAPLVIDTPTTDAIRNLKSAASRLESLVNDRDNLKNLKKQFLVVDQAWGKMVNKIKLLPPRSNVYLLRSAARLDRLHDRLFRLLGVSGKRTIFTFRI